MSSRTTENLGNLGKKLKLSCISLFHMKTRVCLKYPVNNCRLRRKINWTKQQIRLANTLIMLILRN